MVLPMKMMVMSKGQTKNRPPCVEKYLGGESRRNGKDKLEVHMEERAGFDQRSMEPRPVFSAQAPKRVL